MEDSVYRKDEIKDIIDEAVELIILETEDEKEIDILSEIRARLYGAFDLA